MTTDTSREAVEAAADRLERALDPDKRGGWSRLMSRGEEGDEIADFRTVIAGARARDKFAANLDAVKATYAEIIDVLDRLPNTVRETRRIRRLSLRAASAQIGVSFSTLDRFESRSARAIGIQLDPVVRIMRWLDSGADTDEGSER